MSEKEIEQLNDDELMKKFPSTDLVYNIALASYDNMIKRIDGLDGRIQTLTAFAVTACLAIPTLGKVQNLSFRSGWFWAAMFGMLLAVSVSAYARLTGQVRMLNPENLHKGSLHLPIATFKLYAISYAAESFKKNNEHLVSKWRLSVFCMVIFTLTLLCLLVWVAKGSA